MTTPRFFAWNSLLLAEYFSPASAGEEVWIQTNRIELDALGLHMGGADGLVNAVREGPSWFDAIEEDCAHVAARLARQRRSTLRSTSYVDPGSMDATYAGTRAPTYLPILALWVLASSESEEAGFYAKVSALLQANFQNSPKLTEAMSSAWEDLEHWSKTECKGRFGSFQRRVLGKHRFVGMPRSQCLVTAKDLRGLHELFSRLALRPGQRLTQKLFLHAAQEGGNAYYLSRGLQRAFRDDIYHAPLQRILEQAFNAWDGSRPSRGTHYNKPSNKAVDEEESIDCTTIGLVPTGIDGWSIQLRFQASGLGSKCAVAFKDTRIAAKLEPWSGTFCTQGDERDQQALCAVLARSGKEDVEHQIQYVDEGTGSLEGDFRTGRIEQRSVRTLAWDTPDPQRGEILVERPMPVYGPVYLVCSSKYRKKLARNLTRERIKHGKMKPMGLPDGWTLTCIENVERLTREQRELISNSEQFDDAQSRIRFVGGRTLMRGWTRRFAWYDLPLLEVEAPPNAQVRADGVKLEPLASDGSNPRSFVRHFRISIPEGPRHVFGFRVIIGGLEIASAQLRVVPPGGTSTAHANTYSLDRLGRPKQDNDGLRGARIGAAESKNNPTSGSKLVGIKSLSVRPAESFRDSACAKFLDSLAVLGSMGYGPARDQLQRLGGTDAEPAFVILDLWRRGHLEVEVDNRGHMYRLHATCPTLYSLPASHEGRPLHGVCGTLRLRHWQELADHGECIVSVDSPTSDRLPALRLAIEDVSAARIANDLGFDFEQLPCKPISGWASSIDSARDKLASWGRSQFSAGLEQLQRLHPATAQFKSVTSRKMEVEQMVKSQLFRFDDPKLPGLRVYMLGTITADGQTSFSFIRDSRWGVWISLVAFTRMLREEHGREDIDPWPIPYHGDSRELWLPASLRPPVVLERGLVLCSGSSPRSIKMMKRPAEGGRLKLVDERSGLAVGWASAAYEDFVPGTWLCYQWVPRQIAATVAERLGGVIMESSSHRIP